MALWTVAYQTHVSIDSPGKHTGVGIHALLQGIFQTWGSNPSLLGLSHRQAESLPLSNLESPDGCCRRWDQDEKNLEGVGWGERSPSNISVRAVFSFHSFEEYTVRMGSTLLRPQLGMVIPVRDIVCHSFYDVRTLINDIALVLLAHSVNYSAYIQPVSP